MSRKLASIQRITSIEPHPNADTLEIAKVLGWTAIVKKGEFKPGDEIVYCEIDSVLPSKPEFEFLAKYKYRVRTIKLRGVISQGICFPKTVLGKDIMNNFHEGDDVTELMGITKYEPPISEHLAGVVKGNFPYFVPKTDEDRITAIPELFEKYKTTPGYVTEKLDGTSVTYYWNEYFGVCSRNLELKYDESNKGNILCKYALEHELEARLKLYCEKVGYNLALQGEMIGEKIQGNRYKIHGNEYYIFSIYNISKGQYLDSDDMFKVTKELGLNTVPLRAFPEIPFNSIDDMVEYVAKMVSNLNSAIPVEGIVWRSVKEQKCELTSKGRLSFKVINPEYLLKFDQ